MEIMLVIIIIAILTSVAQPIIIAITDQGRVAATKATFKNLKTALNSYKSNMGHYPHAGLGRRKYNGAYYQNCTESGLGDTVETNVLLSDEVVSGVTDTPHCWSQFGLSNAIYQRRWQGPYMDGDPEDFMSDAWGNYIIYGAWKKTIFFHSAGADGSFDPVEEIIGCLDYQTDGDDIVKVIARTRKALTADGSSDAVGCTVDDFDQE